MRAVCDCDCEHSEYAHVIQSTENGDKSIGETFVKPLPALPKFEEQENEESYQSSNLQQSSPQKLLSDGGKDEAQDETDKGSEDNLRANNEILGFDPLQYVYVIKLVSRRKQISLPKKLPFFDTRF